MSSTGTDGTTTAATTTAATTTTLTTALTAPAAATPAAVVPAPARDHVVRPGWFTRRVLNRAVAWMTRRGISVWGSRVLAVRGRKSGEWRRTPVNVLTVDGERYLVAPRGHVQWTHNMRAAGGGQLHLGRYAEEFTAVEVPDDEKPALLRAYLKRWKAEVGVFFGGVGPASADEELRAIAHRHPVFRITAAGPVAPAA